MRTLLQIFRRIFQILKHRFGLERSLRKYWLQATSLLCFF